MIRRLASKGFRRGSGETSTRPAAPALLLAALVPLLPTASLGRPAVSVVDLPHTINRFGPDELGGIRAIVIISEVYIAGSVTKFFALQSFGDHSGDNDLVEIPVEDPDRSIAFSPVRSVGEGTCDLDQAQFFKRDDGSIFLAMSSRIGPKADQMPYLPTPQKIKIFKLVLGPLATGPGLNFRPVANQISPGELCNAEEIDSLMLDLVSAMPTAQKP
jgi:hypothetical protein